MVKTEWETQASIKSGWRVWFWYQGKPHSGYIQKVNDDQTFKIAVYYIDGIALGRYKILDNIPRIDNYQWEKKRKEHEK